MFTGIIQEIGVIKGKKKNSAHSGFSFFIGSRKLKPANGDSISVNGACLTVTKKNKGGFEVDVVPETLSRTNLGRLAAGARVNLEPSMKAADAFDGHFVTGHIDATAKVIAKNRGGLEIELPKKLRPFIAEKGSIAINGVSLTIARTDAKTFSAALISYTEKNTNLGAVDKGDIINIEVDLIARYLYNFYKK